MRILTKIVLLCMLLCTTFNIQAQTENVTWLTLEQALEKSKTDKRPIFIDVFTDWCGWCKVMDQKTFSQPNVARLLNEKFYAVKFNAEQKGDVVFKGHTYRFVSQGRNGYHELAAALLNNQLSYPTVVFLNEDFGMIQPIPGYHEAKEFYQMADFVGSGKYKAIPWTDFQKGLQISFLSLTDNKKAVLIRQPFSYAH